MDDTTRPAATSTSSNRGRKNLGALPFGPAPIKAAEDWLRKHRHADLIPSAPEPLVSVLIAAEEASPEADAAVTTLKTQALTSWEPVLTGAQPDGAALRRAFSRCQGEYVAWLGPGTQWDPGRLARIVAAAQQADAEGAYDGLHAIAEGRDDRYYDREVTPEQLRYRGELDPERLVARRSVIQDIGVDERLMGAWLFDLTSALVLRGRLVHVPPVGATRDDDVRKQALAADERERPYPDYARLPTAHDVVRNLRVLPWADLPAPAAPARISLLVLVTDGELDDGQQLSGACVAALEPAAVAGDVEVLLVDNGLTAERARSLDDLADGRDWLCVVHHPIQLGRALALNLAATEATGATLVFLDDTCLPEPGWLESLLPALDGAVAVAPLVRWLQSGLIDNAGLAFPETGGLPHALLADFPVEDVPGPRAVRAVPGPVLAVRWADFVEARGFDAAFRNELEYADLALRLSELHDRGCTVVTDSVMWRKRPGEIEASPGWGRVNRSVFVDRWRAVPPDARGLWRESDLELVAFRSEEASYLDRRLLRQQPVLRRAPRTTGTGTPSLRWAIKNPAPAGQQGAHWGDTHFARHLAEALRSLGQEVVIDHQSGFDRATGQLDDVVLVLRGLASYRPVWGQISLGWLISHPELMTRREAVGYDRLFAASAPWAQRRAADWGLRIDPLLQATDPVVFHPGGAEPDSGHDVLFVGGARRSPRPLLEMALEADLPLAVYGGGWRERLPEGMVRADYMPNDQLAAAYRGAGIVLSDHWAEMREEGFIANRLFDAVAAGARVVSDDIGDVGDLFGRSVVTVGSAEELTAVFRSDRDEVFGDDAERLDVAARIAREHSFLVRARQLLDAALEIRAERGWAAVSELPRPR